MRIPTRYELKQMEREQDKKYILEKFENFEVNEETAFESLVNSLTHWQIPALDKWPYLNLGYWIVQLIPSVWNI